MEDNEIILIRTAYEVQLDFALSSGLRSEIIWDLLSANQGDILKTKIETLLSNVGNPSTVNEIQKTVFKNIWSQRKYTNGNSLTSIIYVLVAHNANNNEEANASRSFTCHPVFRTRKCLNILDGSSNGCCMIFIDEHGRTYKNWSNYLSNNVLPKGIMIAPKNGIYTFTLNNQIEIEYHFTQASNVRSKIVERTDTVATVAGISSLIPVALSFAVPIAAPVLVASTIASLATAGYSTARSAYQLTDRGIHGQSLALNSRAARNNWFGVISGAVGIGAVGATKALNIVASEGGNITMATKLTIGGMNASSLLISGVGFTNSVYDIFLKYKFEDDINAMDILQLTSCLIVFTHSINNLIITSKVGVTNATNIRGELARRMRKVFDKISNMNPLTDGSVGVGSSTGKFDLIRIVNEIPLKDSLLNLHKSYNHLNDGNIVAALANSLIFNVPYIIKDTFDIDLIALAERYGEKFVKLISDTESLKVLIASLWNYFTENVVFFLIRLTKLFIDLFIDELSHNLRIYISTEQILYRIFMHCIEKYKRFDYNYLEEKTCEILNAINIYFKELNPINCRNTRKFCNDCNGYNFITKL